MNRLLLCALLSGLACNAHAQEAARGCLTTAPAR